MTFDTLPLTGRLLGVDLGEVRVGLAISDPSQTIASTLDTLDVKRDDTHDMLEKVVAAVNAHDPAGVVVGLPRTLDGRDGAKGAKARRFATALHEAIGRPVALIDERFSTVEAERVLIGADVSRKKRKTVIDQVAASVVLQHALERQRARRNATDPKDLS